MGTRAIIQVEGFTVCSLYKHYDGYPEATLAWLQAFNKKFAVEHGNDLPYKFAQLVRSSAFDCEEFNLDGSKITGWGIYPYYTYAGQDFEYLLKADGTVSYKEV